MADAAGLLGLSMRAGQLVSGMFAVEKLLKARGAALVVLDIAASENTQARVRSLAENIPVTVMPEGLLEQAIGVEGRKVAALRPGHLAQRLMDIEDAKM